MSNDSVKASRKKEMGDPDSVAPVPVIVAPPVDVQLGPVYYGAPGWYHGRKRGCYKYLW
jgi:hypothetical protein